MPLPKLQKITRLNLKNLILVFLICSFVGGVFIVLNLINIQAQPKALLIVESGEVYYSNDNIEYIMVTEGEVALNSGAYIKTNIGKAHVLLPNNSVITIDENTNIKLTYNPSVIDVLQMIGNTWHRVRNLGGVGYKVTTPNAIAAVRGTEFNVMVTKVDDQIQTEVIVTEHQVDLAQLATPNVSLNVVEGMVGKVIGVGEVKISPIPQTVKESQWFIENQTLSSELDVSQVPGELQTSVDIIKNNVDPTVGVTSEPGDPTGGANPVLENTPVPTVVPTTGPDGNNNTDNNTDNNPNNPNDPVVIPSVTITTAPPVPTATTVPPTTTVPTVIPTATPTPIPPSGFDTEFGNMFRYYFTLVLNDNAFCQRFRTPYSPGYVLGQFSNIETKWGQPHRNDLGTAVNLAFAGCSGSPLDQSEINNINGAIPAYYDKYR